MARQTKVVLVLLLALAATSLAIDVKKKSCCPDGWEKYGERCFKYQATNMDMASAEKQLFPGLGGSRKYCVNLGANVISIHSADEYQWFKSFVSAADTKNNPTWIGLHNCQKKNTWLWSDGTQLTFTMWSSAEPNFVGTECCVLMNWGPNKDWLDAPCEWTYPFVCAKRIN